MCIYLCISVFSVFRIVNATSTEASLAPGSDQLYSINSWQGVHKVHKVVQLGLSREYADYFIYVLTKFNYADMSQLV